MDPTPTPPGDESDDVNGGDALERDDVETGPGYTWDDEQGEPPKRPRWILPALIIPIIGLIVANNIGAGMFISNLQPSGLVENPLQVLALNSTNKILLATGYQTDLWWFVVISTLRLLAPDPLFYLVGYLYRAQAVRFGRRVYPGAGRIFDLFEREDHQGARRLLDGLVFVMPNNPVCLLAGVAGMPVRRFFVINLAGTLARIALFRSLSQIFREEVQAITEFIARYQRWALLITVGLIVLALVAQARRVVAGTDELS
jgi:membrane protein DedA with SNARE-associated domain